MLRAEDNILMFMGSPESSQVSVFSSPLVIELKRDFEDKWDLPYVCLVLSWFLILEVQCPRYCSL